MSGSDSNSESDAEIPDKINDLIKSAINMKPEVRKQNKSKASFKPLRAKLNKTTLQLDKKRSTRIEQRKEFNECYTELQNDLSKVASKLQVFHECVTSIFDRMECLEERIAFRVSTEFYK